MAVILSYLLSTIALESVSSNQWVFKLTTGTVYYSLCIAFVGALCWQLYTLCGCNLILPVVDYCLGIGKFQSMGVQVNHWHCILFFVYSVCWCVVLATVHVVWL